MKALIAISALLVTIQCAAQSRWSSTFSNPAQNPIGISGKQPLNSKEWFVDTITQSPLRIWRPFLSYNEAVNWLVAGQRFMGTCAYVDSTGTLSNGVVTGGTLLRYVYNANLSLVFDGVVGGGVNNTLWSGAGGVISSNSSYSVVSVPFLTVSQDAAVTGGFSAQTVQLNHPTTNMILSSTQNTTGRRYVKFFSGSQQDSAATQADLRALPIANSWSLTGTSGTTPGTNFIGTTDNKDLVFKIGGQNAGRLGLQSQSTSFGLQALNTNPNSFANTAYGTASLYSINGGEENTAIGYTSMYFNSTGSYNSSLGWNTLGSLTSGNSNTALGTYALRAMTTGNNNLGIGAFAGQFITGGSNQIIINSRNRNDYNDDTISSPIYIQQASTIANQRIKLAGQVQLPVLSGSGNDNLVLGVTTDGTIIKKTIPSSGTSFTVDSTSTNVNLFLHNNVLSGALNLNGNISGLLNYSNFSSAGYGSNTLTSKFYVDSVAALAFRTITQPDDSTARFIRGNGSYIDFPLGGSGSSSSSTVYPATSEPADPPNNSCVTWFGLDNGEYHFRIKKNIGGVITKATIY